MHRRSFLQLGVGATLGSRVLRAVGQAPSNCVPQSITFPTPPAFSVIPVVGDGKWIWNQPPEGQTGYLEPRAYRVRIGVDLEGNGSVGDVLATTVVPVECPEQKLEEERIEASGCRAEVRQLSPTARQLVVYAPEMEKGQKVSAAVTFKATISKQFLGYERSQFPEKQSVAADVRRQYLGDSPGIETHSPQVKSLAKELNAGEKHPWDLAQRFAEWIPKHIRPQQGPYTNVVTALEKRVGDCEEMSAVFVALCRAVGIPARLVWIPNHNWAEFHLADTDGQGHWIPAHTACYSWFGWVGAHELILQKGDRVATPEKRAHQRLLADWMQWSGARPNVRYRAELTPEPAATGDDPGPGARRKLETGEWKVTGDHPADKYIRR